MRDLAVYGSMAIATFAVIFGACAAAWRLGVAAERERVNEMTRRVRE